jgi:hypothetical protein
MQISVVIKFVKLFKKLQKKRIRSVFDCKEQIFQNFSYGIGVISDFRQNQFTSDFQMIRFCVAIGRREDLT